MSFEYFVRFMDYQNSFENFFVRRVHTCCMQSLVQISQIAYEDFEKVWFSFFLRRKSYCENGRGLHHTIQLNSGNTYI